MNEDMSKVLVVEEEPSLLTVVRYHLESAGFEGVFAGEIGEGWRLMVSEAPDLAVQEIRRRAADKRFLQRQVSIHAVYAGG